MNDFIGKYLTPFQRKLLQKNLQDDLPKQYRQRLEIMLLADEGKTQTEICKALGCSSGTARFWISIARTGQAHDWQNSHIGRPKAVTEQYRERLRELVLQSPKELGYSFRCWTAEWLGKHLNKEFGIGISDRHINRLLKEMGLSTKPQTITDRQPEQTHILIRDLSSLDEIEANRLEYRIRLPFNPSERR